MNRPNILMIAVDCLRSDRVFAKDRTCRTPSIDDLVKRGIGLPNMIVENSITAPAFTSLLTGCYSLAHDVTGLLGVRMNPEMVTAADLLVANGYHTYAEVTGPLLPAVGLDQGFDEYNYRDQSEYFFTPWGEKLLQRFREGGFIEPWFVMVHFWEVHEPRQVPPEFDAPEWGATRYDQAVSALDGYIGKLAEAAGEKTTVLFTGDHGERVTEKINPDSLLPYFMNKLNIPMLDKEEDTRVMEDVELLHKRGQELHDVSRNLLTTTGKGENRLGWGSRLKMLFKLIRVALTRMRTQKRKPGWSGFVELLRLKWNDFLIGWSVFRGNAMAAQMQLLRTTLGQFYLQHGYHIYEYLSRVPFVAVNLPEQQQSKRVEAEVRNIDVLPTLCEALSLDLPSLSWHGESFLSALNGETDASRPLYMETRGGAQATHAFYVRGVRASGFKLAYAPNEKQAPVELYDLKNDPHEQANIASSYPDMVKRLRDEAESMAQALVQSGDAREVSPQEQAAMIEKLKSLGYM